jgi:hypothetical protein
MELVNDKIDTAIRKQIPITNPMHIYTYHAPYKMHEIKIPWWRLKRQMGWGIELNLAKHYGTRK